MLGLGRSHDAGLVFHQRIDLAVYALGNRAGFGGVAGDGPLAAGILLEQQIDQAHMAAPEAGHDGGLAVECTGGNVSAFEPS